MLRISIWLLLIFFSVSSATAANLEKGINAIKHGNFESAYRELKPLAEIGDSSALYNLGIMYIKGLGVNRDPKQATEWLLLSAKQNNFLAQYFLGHIFAKGNGVTKDYKKALKFYKLAAEQGHPAAQTNLGAMYYFGHGIGQNNVLAHLWWAIASFQVEGARRNRDMVENKMSSHEIAKSKNLLKLCLEKEYKGC